MSNNQLKGKLIAIMDKQQVTDTFSKREFVIETDEQYPQQVKFELIQAKCEDIDNHKLGDEITVHFNVVGRKWVDKQSKDVYFVSLKAWRIEKEAAAPDSATFASAEPPTQETFDDGLPFKDSTKLRSRV